MHSFRESTRRGAAASSAAPKSRSGAIGRASVRPGGVRSSMATARNVRHASVAPRIDRSGAISPADSVSSVGTSATAGTKRKERDFESDAGGEETNINVVVRCRGRNDREVKENSAVVVSTEGVKGKVVDLSMGPTALSNKTYSFDRVFSSAADQRMIFDDVVKPILDEMLSGYNCTIFAYGQTGTGKTYTMTGDMTESMGILSDAAGIIPRVLQTLFNKLEIDDTENCVRCSFIELYNEELRDLLSGDDSAKLKIYDDNSRKGHSATVVQGMEERHITNASEGIKRLKEGSVRRQVAATKCNDLSSRSHTVFTITVYIKRQGDNGEDYVSAGKLNLVDLAGSENIQRSGAENKRAAEAGLINKSLLTLGRVINALVDRGSHIPYRESKLTRLLQDSLGGRTKTCIIATISPAKSNLEETISTLDYAFRAKNIRNKPQINAVMSKKTLLREFTAEIEKLRCELVATRQRNGVYLSNEAYEEMTVQNESRRILTEEQGAKMETMEANLRNKGQELFDLTSSFMGLKKEHEGTRLALDGTREVLDRTELVLAATRRTLAEEARLRRAHEETEERLASIGGELIGTLNTTVEHVGGLRAKNRRRSDLHALNRGVFALSQGRVAEVTGLVESRIDGFRRDQEEHISAVSGRMQAFVRSELEALAGTRRLVDDGLSQFAASRRELLEHREASRAEMDAVLEEIRAVRDSVRERVGESLQAIAAAAERIAADVLAELGLLHGQLHSSYSTLGRELKAVFEELALRLAGQRAESDGLRRRLEASSEALVRSNGAAAARVAEVVAEERRVAAEERRVLLQQVATLVNAQAEAADARLAGRAAELSRGLLDSTGGFEAGVAGYSEGMDALAEKEVEVLAGLARGRDGLKERLKEDWNTANNHSTKIQNTTRSVHAETVRVVDEQMRDLDAQMQDLDGSVGRARSQNAHDHARDAATLARLSQAVESSHDQLRQRSGEALERAQALGAGVGAGAAGLEAGLGGLDELVRMPLAQLRGEVAAAGLSEYQPTGETPEKVQFAYPTELPRTEAHDVLIRALHGDAEADEEEEVGAEAARPGTPSKSSAPAAGTIVFSDFDASAAAAGGRSRSPSGSSSTATAAGGGGGGRGGGSSNPLAMSLRELNPNLGAGALHFMPGAGTMSFSGLPVVSGMGGGDNHTMPLFRRSARAARKDGGGGGGGGKAAMGSGAGVGPGAGSGGGNKTVAGILAFEGRENVPPSFGGSVARRKSPRLN